VSLFDRNWPGADLVAAIRAAGGAGRRPVWSPPVLWPPKSV